jgi:hypothetical protein
LRPKKPCREWNTVLICIKSNICGINKPFRKYQHVIVGTSDVTMTEMYWNPNDPNRSKIDQEKLVPLNAISIVSLAGYYNAGDKQQHIIMSDKQGNAWEIHWKPFPDY